MNDYFNRLVINSDFLLYQKKKKILFLGFLYKKNQLFHITAISYIGVSFFVLENPSELETRLISAANRLISGLIIALVYLPVLNTVEVVLKQKVWNGQRTCARSCGNLALDLPGNESFLLLLGSQGVNYLLIHLANLCWAINMNVSPSGLGQKPRDFAQQW